MALLAEFLNIKDKSIFVAFLTRKMISDRKPKVSLHCVQGKEVAQETRDCYISYMENDIFEF